MILPHVDHLYQFIVLFPSTETVKTGAKLVPGCDNMGVPENWGSENQFVQYYPAW